MSTIIDAKSKCHFDDFSCKIFSRPIRVSGTYEYEPVKNNDLTFNIKREHDLRFYCTWSTSCKIFTFNFEY
jgi:hypothetical protein